MGESGEGERTPGPFGPPPGADTGPGAGPPSGAARPPRPGDDPARVFARERPPADGASQGPFSTGTSYPGYQAPGAVPGSISGSIPGSIPGYGYGYGYAGPPKVDKGARHALVLALVGIPGSLLLCGIVLGPAAIVEGLKARKRIRLANGRLTGDGMAIAGIAIGALVLAFCVFSIAVAIIGATTTPTSRLR